MRGPSYCVTQLAATLVKFTRTMKNYTLIHETGCTTYCDFSTCIPRDRPQQRAWPFARMYWAPTTVVTDLTVTTCLAVFCQPTIMLYVYIANTPLEVSVEFGYPFQVMRPGSRNNQHYALNCTTPLFYILAPTCFGSSLPLSRSFWVRLSYLK
jgi:hypothetical protein